MNVSTSHDPTPLDATPANAHYGIPAHWAASVDVACTRWLRARGLLASQIDLKLAKAQGNAAAVRRKFRGGW